MEERITKKYPTTLVPNGITTLEALLEGSKLCPDRMRLLLHQFSLTSLMTLGKTEPSHEGWCQAHSRILTMAATVCYPQYIRWLTDMGFLEIKKGFNDAKTYWPGKMSQRYRFTEKALIVKEDRVFHREQIRSHKALKAALGLKKYFEDRPVKEGSLPLSPTHHQLVEMVKMVKFDLDAFRHAMKTEEFTSALPQKKKNILNEALEAMAAMNEGDFNFAKVDQFGERLHTQLTRLWGTLRDFIYFDGFKDEPVVVLDFANSQPYFASVACSGAFIQDLLPEFSKCLDIAAEFEKRDDFKRYATSCAEGTFYDHWALLRDLPRKEAKTELINHVMFGKPRSTYPVVRTARRKFGVHFPSALQMFDDIKMLSEKELPFLELLYIDDNGEYIGRKAFYKNLACLLQRAESRFVLGRIAPAMIKAGIQPFITIHDSFIVLESYEGKVRDIIRKECDSLGIPPPTIKKTGLGIAS